MFITIKMKYETHHNSTMLTYEYVVQHKAECNLTGCHYCKCHYGECCYGECPYGECYYVECHYDECHYCGYHCGEFIMF
jgi:hypothetical protein